jgi:hypothetical protein
MRQARLYHRDWISISWHIDDVLEVRPDLMKAQARKVLAAVDDGHDATIGVDWDVLRFHADNLFPEPDES